MTKDEYNRALNNIAGTFGTLKDQVNSAFEIGRALGLDDMQIGNDVRSKIKGLMSTSTIQRMLPETAKHMKHASEPVKMTGSSKVQKLHNQARLVVPEEPTIPPRPETVVEVEPEPPKPIDEPIAMPKIIEVVFDPAPIDRDRTQVFILQIDPIAKKVMKYRTVGRRTRLG